MVSPTLAKRVLRYVTRQTIPLLRHVPVPDPATATCFQPDDPVSATCSSGRPGYCDMLPASRHR